jgi:signal transduction histidine kinase
MNKIVLLCTFYFLCCISYSQKDTLQYLSKSAWDNQKAAILHEYLSDHYLSIDEPIPSHINDFFQNREAVSDVKLRFKLLFTGAAYYQDNRKIDEAIKFYNAADHDFHIVTDAESRVGYLSTKGYFFRMASLNKEAIENLYQALEIASTYDSLSSSLFMINYEMGNCYMNLSNYKAAIESFEAAIQNADDNGTPSQKAYAYNSLSIVYLDSNSFDKSLYYSLMADSILQAENNLTNINHVKRNIANALASKGENDDHVLELYLSILDTDIESNDTYGMMLSYKSLASVSNNLGKYPDAINYSLRSINLANEIGDQENLFRGLYSLSVAYEGNENYEKAYQFLDSANTVEKRIKGIEINKQVSELEAKYETKRKENELLEAKAEKATTELKLSNQRLISYGLTGGILVLSLLAFSVLQRSKRKHQADIIKEKEKGFAQVIEATENERDRISKDLHDGIGQQLTALKLSLSSLSKKVGEQYQGDISSIVESFSKSTEDVRLLSHQMMPRMLMEFGLSEAIDDLLKNSFLHSEINYEFQHRGLDQRIDKNVEIAVYRVIQELISNTLKHAKASNFSVQLIRTNKKLAGFVMDDGKGFNSDQLANGHGLNNMKSRISLIGGTINIDSSPNQGVSVSISIPLS